MTYLGLDISTGAVKLATVKGSAVYRLHCFVLMGELPREGQRVACSDALVKELRDLVRREKISVKNCTLVLPPSAAFVRHVTVPFMTAKQLKVNLPYELHDYIQQDKDEYFYDYVVVDTLEESSGGAKKLNLLIAATPKRVIQQWRSMLRRTGLGFVVVVPEYLTYRDLISTYEKAHEDDHPCEYCIADLGYCSIRVHMYRGCTYETTRVIEHSDAPVRQVAMGPQEEADRLSAQDHYIRIAVEILRAVNFYGFNTPDSDLQDIYFGGGLAPSPELMKVLRETLRPNIHSVAELVPNDDGALAELCPVAVGAALEMNGRWRQLGEGAKGPIKATINLAQRDYRLRGLGIMLLIAAASLIAVLLFCKLGIIDPLVAAACAETQAERQEEQASRLKDKTVNYEQVLKQYQIETQTQPRLSRQADPMKCLRLIKDELLVNAQVSSFAASSPVITAKLSGVTLNNISSIYQRLMPSGMVENMQVYTAATDEKDKTATAATTVTLVVGKPAAASSGRGASS